MSRYAVVNGNGQYDGIPFSPLTDDEISARAKVLYDQAAVWRRRSGEALAPTHRFRGEIYSLELRIEELEEELHDLRVRRGELLKATEAAEAASRWQTLEQEHRTRYDAARELELALAARRISDARARRVGRVVRDSNREQS